MKPVLRLAAIAVGLLTLLAIGCVYGASAYYSSEHGRGCASCHEMSSYVQAAHDSAHRGVKCVQCHDASLRTKLRHTWVHLTRRWPDAIRLRETDVLAMTANCAQCHQQEHAAWQAGPHSATYAQIFTSRGRKALAPVMEDCLRCHGMHFQGSIRDLVQPQNTTGPWHLVHAELADQPTMPCAACHWIHSAGTPATKPQARFSVADPPAPATLAFFDRREQLHFAAASLDLPQLHDAALAVHMSQDPRQGICYQCHAPRNPEAGSVAAANSWGMQVGSGDDRTPMGVHAGLSCFACHAGHSENARASCKNCHPQMSHCGIDVEKMDTTYLSAASAHNIHWVKCTDCHQHGIPKIQAPSPTESQLQISSGSKG